MKKIFVFALILNLGLFFTACNSEPETIEIVAEFIYEESNQQIDHVLDLIRNHPLTLSYEFLSAEDLTEQTIQMLAGEDENIATLLREANPVLASVVRVWTSDNHASEVREFLAKLEYIQFVH